MLTTKDTALLVGRLSILPLFLISAWGKYTGFAGLEANLAGKGLPVPELLAVLALAAEGAGAIAFGLGLLGRLAAAGLAVYTVLVSLAIHNFWALEGAAQQGQLIHFLKNVGLIGLFLVFAVTGPGRISLDHLRTRWVQQAVAH